MSKMIVAIRRKITAARTGFRYQYERFLRTLDVDDTPETRVFVAVGLSVALFYLCAFVVFILRLVSAASDALSVASFTI